MKIKVPVYSPHPKIRLCSIYLLVHRASLLIILVIAFNHVCAFDIQLFETSFEYSSKQGLCAGMFSQVAVVVVEL